MGVSMVLVSKVVLCVVFEPEDDRVERRASRRPLLPCGGAPGGYHRQEASLGECRGGARPRRERGQNAAVSLRRRKCGRRYRGAGGGAWAFIQSVGGHAG